MGMYMPYAALSSALPPASARKALSLGCPTPDREEEENLRVVPPSHTDDFTFRRKGNRLRNTIHSSILWNFSEKLQIVTENSSINGSMSVKRSVMKSGEVSL
jgi:hypothetical protein